MIRSPHLSWTSLYGAVGEPFEGFEMASNIHGREPIQVTNDTFEEFVTDNPAAVVDCWAAWCFPCRFLGPVIEQLAKEHKDVAFGKLNVDENPLIAVRYGIMSIPTLLYFKDGKLVDRTMGAIPKEAIENRLGKLLT